MGNWVGLVNFPQLQQCSVAGLENVICGLQVRCHCAPSIRFVIS